MSALIGVTLTERELASIVDALTLAIDAEDPRDAGECTSRERAAIYARLALILIEARR